MSTLDFVTKDRRRDRLVRIQDVKERTGLSAATIYRRIANGTFPGQVKLGEKSVAWYESDIDDFVAKPSAYHST